MRREGRSWLVQHQHARLYGESLGDLYQLLFSNGESLYRCTGTERHVQGCEQLIHLAIHALPVNAPETITWVTAHEDILGHIQVGEKHRFLLDNSDAQGLGLCRRAQFYHLATDFHHSRVRPVDTCQDLHQRAFTRAVLAHQCMHFAREQTKVHSPQGLHAAKLFGNPIEFNDGVTSLRHTLIPPHGNTYKTGSLRGTMTDEMKCFNSK